MPPKFSPPRPDRAMEWTASAAAGSSKRRGAAERGESVSRAHRILLVRADKPLPSSRIPPPLGSSQVPKIPSDPSPLVSLVRVIPRKIWVRELEVRYAGRMDSSCSPVRESIDDRTTLIWVVVGVANQVVYRDNAGCLELGSVWLEPLQILRYINLGLGVDASAVLCP